MPEAETTPQVLKDMFNAHLGQARPRTSALTDDDDVEVEYRPKAPSAPQVGINSANASACSEV
jgi:hypothetical protein